MNDPFQVVRDFEKALCDYTGAKYVVTTTSCTAALMLAVAWHCRPPMKHGILNIEIPKRTYVSVPMSIIHAGGHPVFREEKWAGAYQLKPLPIWDSARWFTRGMYRGLSFLEGCDPQGFKGQMVCLSFHWTKQLAIGQGGCILHDNDKADEWLRRMRFDGRKEGVAPKDDTFQMIGYHCYMSPRDAAEGLSRLSVFQDTGQPLPNDLYPDLSQLEIFRNDKR